MYIYICMCVCVLHVYIKLYIHRINNEKTTRLCNEI